MNNHWYLGPTCIHIPALCRERWRQIGKWLNHQLECAQEALVNNRLPRRASQPYWTSLLTWVDCKAWNKEHSHFGSHRILPWKIYFISFQHKFKITVNGLNLRCFIEWNKKNIIKVLIYSVFEEIEYLFSSKLWVLWWRDRGFMLYCRIWQVLGCSRGVTYAWSVPYCPSIERIFSSSLVVLAWHRYVASKKLPSCKRVKKM